MKKILLALVVAFLILPQISYAQTGLEETVVETETSTTTPQGVKTPGQQTAPGSRGSIQEQVRQTQEQQQQTRYIRARELFNRLIKRLNAAVERLTTMGQRIDGRLTILANRGVEVSALQDDLTQSQEMLGSVKIKIETLEADFEEALAAQNPKLAFETVRQNVSSIKTDLVTVLETYAQIVRQMKGLSEGASENTATSSGTTQ